MFRRSPHGQRALFVLLALAICLSGCEDGSRDPQLNTGGSSTGGPVQGMRPLRIASFNIQSFGTKKLGDAAAMRIIVDVIRRFDIVAVQEIRSLDQSVVPRFLDQINASGHRYDYVLSPRLGRGSYKEQYLFVYNTASVELDRESVYTILDENDYFHREPMVATFRARVPTGVDPFTFTLINMHTDPDDVPSELSVLDDVYRGVVQQLPIEDDVILIGDLNASPNRYGPLLDLPNIAWALRESQWTNTRRTNSYDNILFSARSTVEFTGRADVIDLREAYGLTLEQALRVSDHMPVWAEFYPNENAQRIRVATPE